MAKEVKKEDRESKRLTAMQETFCWNMAKGMNQKEAAEKAGYSKNAAKEIGHENMTKPHILDRIDEIKTSLLHSENIDNQFIASNFLVLLKDKNTSPGEKIKILAELGKYSGFYEKNNKQKAGRFDDMTEEQLDEEIKRLLDA